MLITLKAVLLVLCLIFYMLYRKQGDQWKWPLLGVAVAGVVAFVAGFFVSAPPPGGDPVPYHHAVGYILGQRVSKAGAPARVMLVQSPGIHFEKQKAILAAERAGLIEGMGGTVEFVEYRPPIEDLDPLEDDAHEYIQAKLWRKHFAAWLEAQPPADALVSFIGLPHRLPKAAMSKLPPIYMLSHTSVTKDSPLSVSGKLRAYVTYRSDYNPDRRPSGKSPDQVFESRYELFEVGGK
jgi:hypothetical protein